MSDNLTPSRRVSLAKQRGAGWERGSYLESLPSDPQKRAQLLAERMDRGIRLFPQRYFQPLSSERFDRRRGVFRERLDDDLHALGESIYQNLPLTLEYGKARVPACIVGFIVGNQSDNRYVFHTTELLDASAKARELLPAAKRNPEPSIIPTYNFPNGTRLSVSEPDKDGLVYIVATGLPSRSDNQPYHLEARPAVVDKGPEDRYWVSSTTMPHENVGSRYWREWNGHLNKPPKSGRTKNKINRLREQDLLAMILADGILRVRDGQRLNNPWPQLGDGWQKALSSLRVEGVVEKIVDGRPRYDYLDDFEQNMALHSWAAYRQGHE